MFFLNSFLLTQHISIMWASVELEYKKEKDIKAESRSQFLWTGEENHVHTSIHIIAECYKCVLQVS